MIANEAREANMAWLQQQVNHVFEPLMLSIVREKPDNAVSFWCFDFYTDADHSSLADQIHGRLHRT